MNENKISKNDQSILNLHKYLIDIIKNPENFNESIDLSSLKSQGSLSKINNKEYGIHPTSLNTLKRRTPALLSGGFNELETLRTQSYESLLKLREPSKIKNNDTSLSIKDLEAELNNLKKTNILLTNLFLDNLKTIDGIQHIDTVDIIKKQLLELSKKMKAFGLLDKDLLSFTEKSNIIPLKGKK
jgi:hypothetical protein